MMGCKVDTYAGYQDDGEHTAGTRILDLIQQRKCHNMAVFVVRNFGGTHIGPQRFECIATVADQAIDSLLKDHPDLVLPHSRSILRVDPEISIPSPLQGTLQNSGGDTVNSRLQAIASESAPSTSFQEPH